MPPLRPNDDPWGWDKDQFTYCDAFEDLLRESAGKPMRDISGSPLERMIDSIHKIKPDWPGPRYWHDVDGISGGREHFARGSHA
jgi:hypothetical protein